jgi:hypothetical protein
VSTGIYGKILLTLEKRAKTTAVDDDGGSKTRKFSPGDIVGLF